MSRSAAEIVREYGPFPGVDDVHGVTYDGQHVWFAGGDKLTAFDPANGKTLRSKHLGGRNAWSRRLGDSDPMIQEGPAAQVNGSGHLVLKSGIAAFGLGAPSGNRREVARNGAPGRLSERE